MDKSTKNDKGRTGLSCVYDKVKSFQSILAILMTLGYLLGTHLSTINSLKMAIASKAERNEVTLLDRKLTRIEVKLEEAIMTKQEFDRLKEYFEGRLMQVLIRQNPTKETNSNDGK